MELAALDERVVEHVDDGPAQPLGSVDDRQDGPSGAQSPLPQTPSDLHCLSGGGAIVALAPTAPVSVGVDAVLVLAE